MQTQNINKLVEQLEHIEKCGLQPFVYVSTSKKGYFNKKYYNDKETATNTKYIYDWKNNFVFDEYSRPAIAFKNTNIRELNEGVICLDFDCKSEEDVELMIEALNKFKELLPDMKGLEISKKRGNFHWFCKLDTLEGIGAQGNIRVGKDSFIEVLTAGKFVRLAPNENYNCITGDYVDFSDLHTINKEMLFKLGKDNFTISEINKSIKKRNIMKFEVEDFKPIEKYEDPKKDFFYSYVKSLGKPSYDETLQIVNVLGGLGWKEVFLSLTPPSKVREYIGMFETAFSGETEYYKSVMKYFKEEKRELKTSEKEKIQDNIYEEIKKSMMSTNYIKTFDFKRIYEKKLVENNLFEFPIADTMKSHIKNLERYKNMLLNYKIEDKSKENKVMIVTKEMIKTTKIDTRIIKESKKIFMKNPRLCFAAQKGVCIFSAGSHMGKSFLSLFLSTQTGLNTLYYAPDQDQSGILNYCKILDETTEIDFSRNNLRIKTDIPLGSENITKDIKENDADIIVFDMFYNIKVKDDEKLSEYEVVNKQLDVISELKEENKDKMFILVHSTAKGNSKDDLSIETAIKGNNSIGHVVDYAWSFGINDEGKYIKCVKDRYPINESRVDIKTDSFVKITDFLKCCN